MVSEPEAAAIYATRYLNKDQKNKILKASLLAQLIICRRLSPTRLLRFSEELEFRIDG